MKFSIRLLIWMICLLLLVPLTLLSVSAEEQTIKQQNQIAANEKISLLMTQQSDYVHKLTDDPQNISGKTNAVIKRYSDQISDLVNSPEAQTVLLTDRFDLLYEQGTAAGILSWIYYSHYEVHPAGNETNTVSEAYQAALQEINDATSITYFQGAAPARPEVENGYTSLLSAIYTAKLDLLKDLENDSVTVNDIFAAAQYYIQNTLRYETLDGTNYEAYFTETVLKITVQRNRDATTQQLRTVFSILFPEESFDQVDNVQIAYQISIFRGSLNNAATVEQMNTLLNHTVSTLLDLLRDGTYVNRYLDSLKAAVSNTSSAATEQEKIAILVPIFENYNLDRYRAEQKDELLAYETSLNPDYTEAEKELLHSVIAEYVDENGILDSCSDKAGIDAETERAKLRADWVDTYLQALEDMKKHDADLTKLLDDAEGIYLRIDHAITVATATDTAAQQKAIEQGKTDFADLIAEAEALAYKEKHAEILNKNTSDMTVHDKDALESAIADSEVLTPDAAEKLKEELTNNVGEKYKKVLRQELQADVKDDACADLRDEYADALCEMADRLSTDNLTELRENADALLVKSEQIAALLDRYNEILSDPAYDSYTPEFQNAIRSIVTDAADTILQATDTSTENLASIVDAALLNLARQSAIAEVVAATDGSLRDDVTAIVKKATDEINQATAEKIPTLKNEAIVAIKQLLLEEELEKKAESLKQAIAEIEGLTDADVADAQARIDGALASAKIALGNASTLGDLEAAKAIFDNGSSTVLKNAATKAIQNKASSLQGTIDAYDFVDSAAKQAMSEATTAEKEAALAKINATTDPDTVLSCLENGLSRLNLLEKRMNEGDRLKAAYLKLMQKKDSYSEHNLDELNTIYTDTLTALFGNPQGDQSDPATLSAAIDHGIAQMCAVPLDRIDTSDKLIANGSTTAPDGYDPLQNGYAGSIEAVDGIPSDATLTILPAEDGETDVEKLIRQAAKNNRIYQANGTPISQELRKLLKTCQLAASLDIGLGDVTLSGNHIYTVSLLLSEHVDLENVLGVVYICEDGSIEFYEVTTEADLLRFTTSHFSNYYVVSERVMNLLPLIIILSVILLCEIIALVVLYLRRARKKKTVQTLSAVMAPSILLTKFRPTGGLVAVCLLGAAVLGLGCWIAYLVIAELRDDEETEEEYPDELPEEEEIFSEPTPKVEEESPLPVAVGVTALAKANDTPCEEEAPTEAPALDAPEELAALNAPAQTPALEAPEEIAVLEAPAETPALDARESFPALDAPAEPTMDEPTTEPEEDTPLYEATFGESIELLHEVSVDEVDALMTDEEAEAQQQTDESDTEIYSGSKRAQVNLDVISQHFAYGDTVTLNSLKEKKLVPKNVGFVKILARGTLNKALTILAQDFSTAALKMILLTGGTPILTHSSPERGGKIKKK